MKVTFIGGGSLRLLPVIRGIFSEIPEFFRDNEENQMKKNESDSNFSEKILSVHDNENGGLTL